VNFNRFLGNFGSISLFAGAISCVLLVLLCIIALAKNHYHLKHFLHLLTKFQAITFSIAIVTLALLLQRNAFEYTIVFNAVEDGLPFFTKLSGLWAGQAGSLLFWSWLMSLAVLLAIRIANRMGRIRYVFWVSLILCATLLFFLVPALFVANAFARFWLSPSGMLTEAIFSPTAHLPFTPADGAGMNPALRHPAMLIHPPTLYLGLIGFFITYAFALSSLILKDNNETWINKIQPITTAAWAFLTCGMFLGSWWAYTILGWGGYWGWDAVEISGLLPWLLSFGLLHSTSSWIRDGKSQKWIYVFSISIVILILFGILLTRSGIIESVHAYTAGGIGPALTILILLHLVFGTFLLTRRWNALGLQSPLQAKQKKELFFHLFNISLVLLVLIYLFGQTLPVTSQLFGRTSSEFQPEQYERISAPILLGILLLTGLSPLSELKDKHPLHFTIILIILLVISCLLPAFLFTTTGLSFLPCLGFFTGIFALLAWITNLLLQWRSVKDSSRHPLGKTGSFLIHTGFLIFALGILGTENLNIQKDIFLDLGESTEIAGHSIKIQTKQEYPTINGQHVYALQVLVQRQNKNIWVLSPEYRYYPKIDTLTASPDIHSIPMRDIQIIITDWQRPGDGRTGLRVHVFPMMSWIWMGGAVMVCGGILQFIKMNSRQ